MARDYPYAHDYAFRPARRGGGSRRTGRGDRAPEPRGPTYARAWNDAAELEERMGMHDLTEHYGRYSGGAPYGYEYSERSIEHRHPGSGEFIGFTRRLARPGARRPRDYDADFARHARTGMTAWPRQSWQAYQPRRRPAARGSWGGADAIAQRARTGDGTRRGGDRYWTFRGNRYWR